MCVLSAEQWLLLYLCCLQIKVCVQHYMECKWQGNAGSILSLLDYTSELHNIQNLISHAKLTASTDTSKKKLISARDRNKMKVIGGTEKAGESLSLGKHCQNWMSQINTCLATYNALVWDMPDEASGQKCCIKCD